MTKKTKFIIVGSSLIVTGVALYFILNKGKQEDMGKTPEGNETDPNNQSNEAQVNESVNTEGSDPISLGDIIFPYGEFANIRTSMEVNNGWFNNMFITGDFYGKVYSPSAIGKVCEINYIAGHTWYKVDLGPLLLNDDICSGIGNLASGGCAWYDNYILTPETINYWEAQDTNTPCNFTGYVRADVVTK